VERTLTPRHEEENNTNGRLTPIPQGELPPEPAQPTTQAPASPATTSRALTLTSLPTLRRSISRKSPLQTSIALAALIVTFIATVYYGHRADKMNLFMMLGAYRQDCWSQRDAGNPSPECEVELGRGMARPPYAYAYAYRRVKRGMEVVGGWVRGLRGQEIVEDSRTETGKALSDYLPKSLIILIPLFIPAAFLLLILFRRRHTSNQRRPQHGPDLVRNVPPFMILKEPKSGQHIGLTQRRTKNTPIKPITLSNRKKSLQDHFEDLHNHPEWKHRLEDIATDDEDEHHGELPGERIARITRTITSSQDFDTDTETGSDVEGDSASVMSKFKRNIREKLHRADTADSTLSALGSLEAVEPAARKSSARPKDNSNPNPNSNTKSKSTPDLDPDSDTVPGYNFRIKKGITSMGLVSIGTTLGASAGGEIGQEMLVKGVDASELGDAKGDLMVPGEPYDVSLVLTTGG
jgi:hypothetical protein